MSESHNYISHTCPSVEKIFAELNKDVLYFCDSVQEGNLEWSYIQKEVQKMMDEVETSIKKEATLPFRKALESALDDKNKRIDDLEDENKTLTKYVAKLEDRVSSLEVDCDSQQERIAELEALLERQSS